MRKKNSAIWLTLFLPLLLVSSSCAEEISLKKEGGVYVVPVEVNGSITLDFVLDSGASDVSIPADVMLTLTRTGTVTSADLLEPMTYRLADGSTVSSPRFIVHRMRIGTIELEDIIASVAPTQGALLLGQSFLSKIASWRIDNNRHLLIVNETDSEAGSKQGKNIVNGDALSASQLSQRGLALAGQGDHENAIQKFSQAIGLTSDNAQLFNNRAISFVQTGNLENAITDYGRAIELAPDYAEAHFGRGLVHSFAGEYTQALSDYAKAISLKPNDADYVYQRGITLANSTIGQYSRAISDFDKAIRLRPNFAMAFFSRGRAHTQLGQLDLAKTDFIRAIKLDPDKFHYKLECLERGANAQEPNDALLNCLNESN
jgi:clan AA aspartic protease (TIGR02281 family)